MQTFTQALIDLGVSGAVDRELAADAATHRHDFLVALEPALKQAAAEHADPEPEPEPVALPGLRVVEG